MSSTPPPSTIDVVAPSDLPEKYQFQVDAGAGKLYTVQVPPGGVTAGQRFSAIVVQGASTVPMGGAAATTASGVPRGHWRDNWTDCFSKLNAQCLLGCFCSSCAVGQVMTRMNLDWKADPFPAGQEKPTLSTFKIVVIITAAYHIIGRIFAAAGLGFMESVVAIFMMVYVTLITYRARKLIRTTYAIPADQCSGCGDDMEDCCCSFWCNPCTACHMARHLNDYDRYSAQCCTDTGLGPEAPPLPEFEHSTNTMHSPPPMPPKQQPEPPQQQQQSQPSSSPPPPTTDQPDEYDREKEKTFVVDL